MRLSENAIHVKRAFEPAEAEDGVRVLVDRLWPRGVSKGEAHLDAWMKELAPSTELRTWFSHQAERWDGFQAKYRDELSTPLRQVFLTELRTVAGTKPLTLVYGAHDPRHNQALVIRQCLLDGQRAPNDVLDTTDILLVTAAAIAAGHADKQIPAVTLELFVAPFLTENDFEKAVLKLQENGDLRETPHGWELTARGQQRVRRKGSAS